MPKSPEGGQPRVPERQKKAKTETPTEVRSRLEAEIARDQATVDAFRAQFDALDDDTASNYGKLGFDAAEASSEGKPDLVAVKRGEQNDLLAEFNAQLALKGIKPVQQAEFVRLTRSRRNITKLEHHDKKYPQNAEPKKTAENKLLTPKEEKEKQLEEWKTVYPELQVAINELSKQDLTDEEFFSGIEKFNATRTDLPPEGSYDTAQVHLPSGLTVRIKKFQNGLLTIGGNVHRDPVSPGEADDSTSPDPAVNAEPEKTGEEPFRVPKEMLEGELADAYAHMDIENARRMDRVARHGDNPTNPMVEAFNQRLAQEGIKPVTHEQYRALARERVMQYTADPERSFLPVDPKALRKFDGGEKPPEVGREAAWTDADELGLQSARTLYADRLRRRSRARWFFSGSSEEEVVSARDSYQALLKQKEGTGLTALKAQFEGRSFADEKTMAEMNVEIASYIVGLRNEEGALREEMHTQTEKSALQKLRHLWRSSAKARMVVGFALTGGAIVAGATGNIPLAAALAGAKGMLSGISMTMATEGAIQMGGERFGLTKRKSADVVNGDDEGYGAMSEKETAERLAAHGFNYTDRNSKGEFGTRNITTWSHLRGEQDNTAQLLAEHYDNIRYQEMQLQLQGLQREGKSNAEIIGVLLNRGLDESLHDNYLTVRDKNRKFAYKKWTASVIIGGLTGVLTGEHLAHMKHAQEAAVAGHGPHVEVGPTHVTSPNGFEHDMVTVNKGDSVWKIVKHQLSERDPNFSHLSAEQQDNMVSTLTNKVIENPHAFGLQDADNLKVGQHLDLGSLFHGSGAPDIHQLHEHATQLSPDQIHNIAQNDETLRDWVAAHPHEQLTSERVQDILSAHHSAADALPHAVEGPPVPAENLPIPLDSHMVKDWSKFAKMHDGLIGKNPDAAKAWEKVVALHVGDVKNWKVIHGVLEQQDVPKAKDIAKATFKVLHGLQKQELLADKETLGHAFERVQAA